MEVSGEISRNITIFIAKKKKRFQQRMIYLLVYTVYVCRWKFEEDQVKLVTLLPRW